MLPKISIERLWLTGSPGKRGQGVNKGVHGETPGQRHLMGKRVVMLAVAAGIVLAGAAAMRWPKTDGAVAQAPQGPRPVSIELATAVKKKTPVMLEGLGTVTTIASVAIRSRIDNEIVG